MAIVQPYKITVKGLLEFGSERAYNTMFDSIVKKTETEFRNDTLFKAYDYFNPEMQRIIIERLIVQSSEKTWRNSVKFLQTAADYAVAGRMWFYVTDDKNQVLARYVIEPSNDKSIVTKFKQGRQLIRDGRGDEAMDILSDVVANCDRHLDAYERRAYVCYKLQRYDDAIIDFSKSIDLYPNADAYFGRAKVHIMRGEIDLALQDLETAIKLSVPLQPIFWLSRRVKGECHIQQRDWDKAIFELQLVTKRNFTNDDPNGYYRQRAFEAYGRVLLEVGRTADSIKAYNMAQEIAAQSKKNNIPSKPTPQYLLKTA
jgi:tetratricopeptide (TPR) repeat protein